MNELLLILSIPLIFGALLLGFVLFKKEGLYLWTVLGTITANIEVLMLVHAFGMDMTLGNVLFASTFLVTDILSEIYSKEESRKAVMVGFFASLCFMVVSQTWMFYHPAAGDFATPAIHTIFSNTPRLILSSMAVYVICQYFDVWFFHKIWDWTNKRDGGQTERFLWLRNNVSTLTSQLINTVLYNIFAFAGVYDTKTVVSIIISCYVIFLVTSLADTPFIYLARSYARKHGVGKYAATV